MVAYSYHGEDCCEVQNPQIVKGMRFRIPNVTRFACRSITSFSDWCASGILDSGRQVRSVGRLRETKK
jgi:hypothetical protein